MGGGGMRTNCTWEFISGEEMFPTRLCPFPNLPTRNRFCQNVMCFTHYLHLRSVTAPFTKMAASQVPRRNRCVGFPFL